MDDISLYQTEDFDRLNKFKAHKKDVVGSTRAIPLEDNDEKFEFYDIQGESVFNNPPDPNNPVIDHGLDEEFIWNFNKNAYNEDVIKNPYYAAFPEEATHSHAPLWGRKLSQPHFYKPEKLEKFLRHWNHRLGLEALKAKQAQN